MSEVLQNHHTKGAAGRAPVVAGVLAALAVGVLAAVAYLLGLGPAMPEATGDIGTVEVYGQTKGGPQKLPADRRVSLPRPQYVAFQLTAEGTGPRWVRVEVEALGEVSVVYEKLHDAPRFKDALGYTLELSEDAPDELTVIVTLEAPHAMSRVARYPIQLVGAESPFWE